MADILAQAPSRAPQTVNESFFKYLTWTFIIVVAWALFSPGSCTGRGDRYDVNVQTRVSAAEGLDLQAIGSLLRKAGNAEQFERLLNDPDEGVNNLDLDEDGNVDYIKVTEYGDDQAKGFSLSVAVGKGDEQEIATVEVDKSSGSHANVDVHGNRHIYGDNHYYHSRFGVTDFLLLSYLFRPHPYYASPYYYGYYPSYYRSYRTVPVSTYRTRARTVSAGTPMKRASASTVRSSVSSPNAKKTASSIKAPLKNPTASQKSFQARSSKSTVKSGGFGRSTSSRPSRPSVRSSSSFRSGGSFGGK